MILLTLHTIACFAIFYVCGSFLLVREKASTTFQFVFQVGLLLLMVGAFTAGAAALTGRTLISWWDMLVRSGAAIIAVYLFERTFGIRKQAKCLYDNITSLPARAVAWWEARLHIAKINARRKP